MTTERLEGGLPVRSVYYVAEEDPAKAEAIVGAVMAPNERVEALGPLPEAAVRALGLNLAISHTHNNPLVEAVERRRASPSFNPQRGEAGQRLRPERFASKRPHRD